MSPTSTSEPPPLPDAAAPASLPVAPPAPTAVSLVRGFLGDGLLAMATLVVASGVLIAPLILFETLRVSAGEPSRVDIDAVMESLLPQIMAASLIAMLIAGAVVWWFRVRRLAWSGAPMPALPAYSLAIAGGVLIQIVCLGLVYLAQQIGTPIAPSNADPVQDMALRAPWLAWITVVGIAPLAEELLFRHVLLRRFAVAGRGLLGLAITSLLFAAMHEVAPGVPSWPAWLAAVALYATMGAGFGAVYLWTRRLGAAVLAHAACNLVAMSLASFSLL